jgi:transcriptional regulator with XRE-family HTH domain
MRELRFFQKKTLADLSLSSGINMARLSFLERSIFLPTSNETKKISKALKVPEKEIFPSPAE